MPTLKEFQEDFNKSLKGLFEAQELSKNRCLIVDKTNKQIIATLNYNTTVGKYYINLRPAVLEAKELNQRLLALDKLNSYAYRSTIEH